MGGEEPPEKEGGPERESIVSLSSPGRTFETVVMGPARAGPTDSTEKPPGPSPNSERVHPKGCPAWGGGVGPSRLASPPGFPGSQHSAAVIYRQGLSASNASNASLPRPRFSEPLSAVPGSSPPPRPPVPPPPP